MDCMIDLETMSSDSGGAAPIIAIGAVAFDPLGKLPEGEPVGGLYVAVQMSSALQNGVIDGDTLDWWLKQSDEARQALFQPPRMELKEALHVLAQYIKINDVTHVWSHATFDHPIIDHAYRVCGIALPWKYKNARDLRTIHALSYGDEGKIPNVPTNMKHHAMYDAWRQAIMVQRCYAKLVEAWSK